MFLRNKRKEEKLLQDMVIDGKERILVPYKGWCINNMGQLVPVPLLQKKEPPLKIVDNIDH